MLLPGKIAFAEGDIMSLLFKTLIAALSATVATTFVHSTLAEDFLSEAEIKTVLGGNTIKYPKRAHRGNAFIYFGTDGEVVSKSDGSNDVSRGSGGWAEFKLHDDGWRLISR